MIKPNKAAKNRGAVSFKDLNAKNIPDSGIYSGSSQLGREVSGENAPWAGGDGVA